MSKPLLLIYTGGTIGMVRSEQGYVPAPGFERLLRDRLAHAPGHPITDFEFIEFEQLLDSANLAPANWLTIAHAILDHYDDYAGFVVLHGTDTMAYTASALSFMLQGLDKPVILTGSQIPITELRNDAKDNLIAAMILAAEYPVNEVCLYFNGQLLRGNRSTKHSASSLDAFGSPNFPALGHVGIGITLNQSLLLPERERRFQLPDYDPEALAALQLFPGISADQVQRMLAGERIRGLILRSYGVGNVPSDNPALMAALESAADRGVVIVNTTQCPQGAVSQTTYATGMRLQQAGVVAGADMTFEAAFAKLHYLLACHEDAALVREAVARELCGELTVTESTVT